MKITQILLLAALTGLIACSKKDTPAPTNNNNTNTNNNDSNKVVASFTYTNDGLVIHFTSTSTNSPTSIAWDFGDGQKGTGDTITHTYTASGSYVVTLTAKKNNDSATTTKTLAVAKMAASFTYTTDGWVAHFTSTSTNSPTSITWDFGDGQQGTGDTVTHAYANPGDYNVQLTAVKGTDNATVTQAVTMKEQILEITTAFGVMDMYLYNQTPAYRDNYIKLAKQAFFDSTTFHRIVANFVIQGGDPLSKDSNPNNDGTGGPGYTIPFSTSPTHLHDFGAVGAASTAARGASSGSQFYIVVQSGGSHSLDGSYAVFGFIMKGMNVATTIVAQPKDANDRPLTNIRMSVKVLEKTKAEVQNEYGYTIH